MTFQAVAIRPKEKKSHEMPRYIFIVKIKQNNIDIIVFLFCFFFCFFFIIIIFCFVFFSKETMLYSW